ncbi:MAG: four helix bundle protein [Actinobacteria bacterium]|nr:MAG: four helix bundle protein [Actinomycetota bacterium]
MHVGVFKLEVAKKAHLLTLDIYKVTNNFPKNETYGLVSQIRRSSMSIPANLAEGYTRKSSKEFKQFINIARGSLAETEYFALLSRDLGYINEEEYLTLNTKVEEVGKMLFGLFHSIDKKTNHSPLASRN